MDLEEWKTSTLNTMKYHFDHDEPAMAFRAYVLAMRELMLARRRAKFDRKFKKWVQDVDAFNAMNDLKNDLRRL